MTDSSNYYSCSMAHDEISANGGQASCVVDEAYSHMTCPCTIV